MNKISIPKNQNSIFLGKTNDIEVLKDLEQIRAGQALFKNGEWITSSGRTWGMHGNSIFPIKGERIINLTRTEYSLLSRYKKIGYEKLLKEQEYTLLNKAISEQQYIENIKFIEKIKEILK